MTESHETWVCLGVTNFTFSTEFLLSFSLLPFISLWNKQYVNKVELFAKKPGYLLNLLSNDCFGEDDKKLVSSKGGGGGQKKTSGARTLSKGVI